MVHLLGRTSTRQDELGEAHSLWRCPSSTTSSVVSSKRFAGSMSTARFPGEDPGPARNPSSVGIEPRASPMSPYLRVIAGVDPEIAGSKITTFSAAMVHGSLLVVAVEKVLQGQVTQQSELIDPICSARGFPCTWEARP
jgi:hypothetical protein